MQMDGVGVGEFEQQQSDNDFEAEASSIDKVSVEEVWIGFGGVAVQFEYVEDVVVLSVGVAAYGETGRDGGVVGIG